MGAKIAAASPIHSLAAFFKARPTSPIDRRRLLQAMGGLGVAAAATTLVFDIAQPKRTIEVNAPAYIPTSETRTALGTLLTSFAALHGQIGELLNAHLSLFIRKVVVEWKKDEEEQYEDCYTDENNEEHCVTKTRTVTRHHEEDATLLIDQDLRQVSRGRLESLNGKYGRQAAAAEELERKGMKLLEGEPGNADWLKAGSDEFARNFGMEWTDGKVSNFSQIALAAAIGLPASALILGYNGIASRLSYRDDYSDDRKEREVGSTRRAFLQMLGGAGAAALVPVLTDSYEDRSEAIRGQGEKEVRQAVVTGNEWNAEQLFNGHFGESPRSLLDELESMISQLRSLTLKEVDRSVRNGIQRLNDKENEIRSDLPFGAYAVSTTRKDDGYDPAQIRQYTNLAHSVAEQSAKVLSKLKDYFKAGVPEALLPAMRAHYITERVDQAVDKEHSAHLWGLAGDLGLLYGGALALLLASEIPGPHHQAVYNLVQGVCDFIDRRKMSAYEIIERLRGSLSSQEKRSILEAREIRQAVRENVRKLKAYADAYVEGGIIYSPVLDTYFGEMDRAARKDLLEQVAKLNEEQMIEVYIRKALVFFTRKQLGPEGLLQAIRNGQAGKDPIAKPDSKELKKKVLELAEQADLYFLYDLVDAGLINDNEPNETWLTAEARDLDGCINYWADRVAGTFASSQSMYAALKILPSAWFLSGKKSDQSLSREEVLSAFEKSIRKELAREEDREKIEHGIRDNFAPNILSEGEIAQRVLLRRLQESVEAHEDISILFEHDPRLQAAVAG